ncbi:hypothetical protein CBL_01439 [Carabus blaptoides fortunei]
MWCWWRVLFLAVGLYASIYKHVVRGCTSLHCTTLYGLNTRWRYVTAFHTSTTSPGGQMKVNVEEEQCSKVILCSAVQQTCYLSWNTGANTTLWGMVGPRDDRAMQYCMSIHLHNANDSGRLEDGYSYITNKRDTESYSFGKSKNLESMLEKTVHVVCDFVILLNV